MSLDVKIINAACKSVLEKAGFSSRYGIFYKDLTDEFKFWVGLNVGKHGDYIRINPFVGVHCVPIMRAVNELHEEKYRALASATYAIHLGELCPNEKQFLFFENAEHEVEASRLASLISDYGLPYAQGISSYEKLLPLIFERVSTLGGNPEAYAVGLFINNQKQEALRFIAKFLEGDLAKKVDDVCVALLKLKDIIDGS